MTVLTAIPTIPEAEAAVKAAEAAVDAANAARRLDLDEVNERHVAPVEAARVALAYAKRELYQAQDRDLPDHPWTDRRVWRVSSKIGRYGSHAKEVRIEGVVQTRRLDTVFPKNASRWRVPAIGQPFVRLFKSDGTLGMMMESMGREGVWKLIED